MLIADFSADIRSRVAPPRRLAVRAARRPHRALAAWLVLGLAAVVLVPFARGDRLLGATLPFWLIVAPLVDLGWIERRRIAHRVTQGLRRLTRERRAVRNVRAQRAPRAAACKAARS